MLESSLYGKRHWIGSAFAGWGTQRETGDLMWMSEDFLPETGARIAAELIKVIGEAQVLAAASEIGPAFREIVRHARELHDLLLSQLIAAEPALGERPLGMATAMGNKLFELEALAEQQLHPSALN